MTIGFLLTDTLLENFTLSFHLRHWRYIILQLELLWTTCASERGFFVHH